MIVFQNNYQVGKSEETTLFAAGIYMCVCKVGTTIQKARKRKEDGKTGKAEEFLFTYEP